MNTVCYRVLPLVVMLMTPSLQEAGVPQTPQTDISIQRVLTGSTTSRGQLSVTIRNFRDFEMRAVYVETLPWHVQFYLHTMKTTIDGVRRGELTHAAFSA